MARRRPGDEHQRRHEPDGLQPEHEQVVADQGQVDGGRLAEPVEDTLFFAGEHTAAGGHHATVHGAIASGRRAAERVLSALGR